MISTSTGESSLKYKYTFMKVYLILIRVAV